MSKTLQLLIILILSSCNSPGSTNKMNDVRSVTSPKFIKTDNPITLELKSKGDSLKKLGQINNAIEFYDKALDLEPSNTSVLNNKALAVSRVDLTKAIEIIDLAIEIDSMIPFLYNNRGLFRYKKKENLLAKMDFQHSIDLDSNQYSAFVNLGLVYHFLNQKPQSCEAINQAVKNGYNIKIDDFVERIYKENCN